MTIVDDQMLMNFDHKKEKIPRQITASTSLCETHGKVNRINLSKDIEKKERSAYTQVEGKLKVISTENDLLEVARIFARYKYALANHYISDIGAGLYTMLTNNQGLIEPSEIYQKDSKGNMKPVGVRIMCSAATICKAAFGPLVNKNANGLDGTGDIIKEAKKIIKPILYGDAPLPQCISSIQNNINGHQIKAVIMGYPFRIIKHHRGANDAFLLELDYSFFPCKFKNNRYSVSQGQPYIQKVAGQTAFLQLGKQLLKKEKDFSDIPHVGIDTSVKVMTCAQGIYELNHFIPGIVRENASGRTNLMFRRNAAINIYPSCYNKKEDKISYKKFSNAVALVGQYFDKAMKQTGIKDDLLKIKSKDGKSPILIPATDKGAEFPGNYPNYAYLKVDKLQ